MENVMMISRHRQWRALQYGRRHSGLFYGRGTSTYGTGGDDDEPKWMGVATAVGLVVIAWWMGGWVAGVTVIVFFALLFALCVWLSRRDKRDDG